MKKSHLKEIIKKSLKETSTSGTGASVSSGTGEGVATKYAFKKKTNAELLKVGQKQQVAEGYNSFKKQVTTKTPRSSSKTAMRVIKRKLKEIHQTLEYSSKLKQELGESSKMNEQQFVEIATLMNEISKKLKKLYK